MRIELKASIFKELEDNWGETYLSTFPEPLGSASVSKHRIHSKEFFNQFGFCVKRTVLVQRNPIMTCDSEVVNHRS